MHLKLQSGRFSRTYFCRRSWSSLLDQSPDDTIGEAHLLYLPWHDMGERREKIEDTTVHIKCKLFEPGDFMPQGLLLEN